MDGVQWGPQCHQPEAVLHLLLLREQPLLALGVPREKAAVIYKAHPSDLLLLVAVRAPCSSAALLQQLITSPPPTGEIWGTKRLLIPSGCAKLQINWNGRILHLKGLQQDFAITYKITASFQISEKLWQVYREDHRNHLRLRYLPGKNFPVKHHFPLENADSSTLICVSSPDFIPNPGHSFFAEKVQCWIQTYSRIKINQWKSLPQKSAQSSLQLWPSHQPHRKFVSKMLRNLCALSAFQGYKLKYFWHRSWPKFLCRVAILGNPTALGITRYWTW